MLKQYLEAGKIVSTQGLNGAVRVQSWCSGPEFLKGFRRFYFDNGETSRDVEDIQTRKSLAILKFQDVDSVDVAKQLVNKVLFIDREDAKLPAGSYFEQDLIGLDVVDSLSGRVYGKIQYVGHTGANDYYAVRGETGEVLMPAIRDVIKAVDIEGGRMLVTPIKGLFDDEN